MINKISAFAVVLFTAASAFANLRQIELDSTKVLTLKVPAVEHDKLTTIMFPGEIESIGGTNVCTKPEEQGSFLLSVQKGSYFFDLRAIEKNATGQLRIIYRHKVYVMDLETAELKKADRSITFTAEQGSGGSNYSKRRRSVSPAIQLAMIDKAKSYPLLVEHQPHTVEDIEYFRPEHPVIIRPTSGEYSNELLEVFRFKEQDTLVFHIALNNHSNHEIRYDPKKFAVRPGAGNLFFCAVPLASGVMPPQSTTFAYFTVTGKSKGGRNNLSAENKWKVILSTLDVKKSLQGIITSEEMAAFQANKSNHVKREEALYREAQELLENIDENMSAEELQKLNNKSQMLVKKLQNNYDDYHSIAKYREQKKLYEEKCSILFKELESDNIPQKRYDEIVTEAKFYQDKLNEINTRLGEQEK